MVTMDTQPSPNTQFCWENLLPLSTIDLFVPKWISHSLWRRPAPSFTLNCHKPVVSTMFCVRKGFCCNDDWWSTHLAFILNFSPPTQAGTQAQLPSASGQEQAESTAVRVHRPLAVRGCAASWHLTSLSLFPLLQIGIIIPPIDLHEGLSAKCPWKQLCYS